MFYGNLDSNESKSINFLLRLYSLYGLTVQRTVMVKVVSLSYLPFLAPGLTHYKGKKLKSQYAFVR